MKRWVLVLVACSKSSTTAPQPEPARTGPPVAAAPVATGHALPALAKAVQTSHTINNAIPTGTAALTPATPCCEQPGQVCAADGTAWQDAIWKALEYTPSGPSKFQYAYTSEDGDSFTLTAVGDPRCDGERVTYSLVGYGGKDTELKLFDVLSAPEGRCKDFKPHVVAPAQRIAVENLVRDNGTALDIGKRPYVLIMGTGEEFEDTSRDIHVVSAKSLTEPGYKQINRLDRAYMSEPREKPFVYRGAFVIGPDGKNWFRLIGDANSASDDAWHACIAHLLATQG